MYDANASSDIDTLEQRGTDDAAAAGAGDGSSLKLGESSVSYGNLDEAQNETTKDIFSDNIKVTNDDSDEENDTTDKLLDRDNETKETLEDSIVLRLWRQKVHCRMTEAP